jgi:hypothetical protein
MKTIGTILYGIVLVAAMLLTAAIIVVLLTNPMDAFAQDAGYPVDEGYPVDAGYPPPQYVEERHICEVAPWMHPDYCDEYLNPEIVEPEIFEPMIETILQPVIQPIIQPITLRMATMYDIYVR